MLPLQPRLIFFFFNDPATTEIYTLSLHDALPIWSLPDRPHVPYRPLLSSAQPWVDRKSTRLNSSHVRISYAVFCLKKKNEYATLLSQAASEIIAVGLDHPCAIYGLQTGSGT